MAASIPFTVRGHSDTARRSVGGMATVDADQPDLLEALRQAGRELAQDAPPLTSEQVDRVVAALRPSVATDVRMGRSE